MKVQDYIDDCGFELKDLYREPVVHNGRLGLVLRQSEKNPECLVVWFGEPNVVGYDVAIAELDVVL